MPSDFDPDAFIGAAPKPFDPDAFLGKPAAPEAPGLYEAIGNNMAAIPIGAAGAAVDTFNRTAQSVYELGAAGARRLGADGAADWLGGVADTSAALREGNARHVSGATAGTYTGPVAEVAGQVGGTAAQTLVNPALAYASLGHGAVSDELRKFGVGAEDRGAVGALGAPLGFVEALPLGKLGKLLPGKLTGGAAAKVAGVAVGEAAEEGIQQVGQNQVVRSLELDPNRPLTEGVGQAMLVGGLAGGALGAGAYGLSKFDTSAADIAADREARLAAVQRATDAAGPVVMQQEPPPAPVVEQAQTHAPAPLAEPAPMVEPVPVAETPTFNPDAFVATPPVATAPVTPPEPAVEHEPAPRVAPPVAADAPGAPVESSSIAGKRIYLSGDAAEYTGESVQVHGATFWNVRMLEGKDAGKIKLSGTSPNGITASRENSKKEWEDMQDGFRRLRESTSKNEPVSFPEPAPRVANPGELFDTADTFNLASVGVTDEAAKLRSRWAREDALAAEPVLPGTEQASGRAAPEVEPVQRLVDAARTMRDRLNKPSIDRMVADLEKAVADGDTNEALAQGREVVLIASRHDGMGDVLEAAQRARTAMMQEPTPPEADPFGMPSAPDAPAAAPRDVAAESRKDVRLLNADLTPKWKRYGNKTLDALIDALDPEAPVNAPTLRDVSPDLADAADRHGIDPAEWFESGMRYRESAAQAEAVASDMEQRGPSLLERILSGEVTLPSKSSFAGEVKALREQFGRRKVKLVQVESVAAGDAHLQHLAESLTTDHGFSTIEGNVGDLLDMLDRAASGEHDRPVWSDRLADLPALPASAARRKVASHASRPGGKPDPGELKGGPAAVPEQEHGVRSLEPEEFDKVTGGAMMAFPDEAVPLDALALGGIIRELQGVDGLVRIRRKLRGGALGTFSPMRRIITLQADLFKRGATEDLVKVTGHELGHLVDFLPEGTMKRGNLGGRMQSVRRFLKEFFPIEAANENEAMSKEERQAVREQVEADMAKLATGPVLDVLVAREAYGRTYGRRNDALATALGVGIPKGTRADMKAAYHAARDRAGKAWTDWLHARSEESAKRILSQMQERGYDKVATLRSELIEWTEKLTPFDRETATSSYVQYRESGEELYAEALTGVFVYPQSLAESAPLFWQAFWGHLDSKPEVRDAYLGALAEMRGTSAERASILSERFRAGVARGASILSDYLAERARKRTVAEWWRDFTQGARRSFVDRKFAGRTKANTGLLDRLEYSDAMKRAWVQKLMREVSEPLVSAGVSQADFGEYLAMRRIAQGDRSDFANPYFHSPESAGVQIFEIMARQTSLGRSAMLSAEARVRALWSEVQEVMVASGLYSPEFIGELRAKAGDAYVPFAVVEHFDGRVGAGVHGVTGTVGDIADPLVALALKAGSAIDASALNAGKVLLVDGLRENGFFQGGEIEPAELAGRDGKGRPFYARAPLGKTLVELRVKGEPVAYYMPHGLAATFDRMTPVSAHAVVASMRWIFTHVVRRALIVWNPGFQYASGPLLDASRAVINMPTLGGKVFVAKEIAANLGARYGILSPTEVGRGVRDFIDGKPSKDMDRMQALGAIPPPEELHNVRTHEDAGHDSMTGMESLLRAYKLEPEVATPDPKWGRAGLRLARWVRGQIERTGATNETAVKLAAYKYAVERLGWSEEKAAEFTLRNIGIPDSRRGGTSARVVSAFLPFANTGVQGITSMAHMFAGSPEFAGIGLKGMKSRKQVAAQVLLTYATTYGAIKLFGALAEAGLLGDELEEWYARLSEYDKAGTLIPLGTVQTAEGLRKSAALRVPVDPLAQFFGEMIRNTVLTLAGKRGATDAGSAAFASSARMSPGLDPTLKTAGIWSDYWKDINPTDDFRNRPVVSPTAWEARKVDGMPAFAEMLGQTGANFGLWSSRPDDGGERTWQERAARLPVLSKVLVVTDAGVTEEAKREMALRRSADAVARLSLPEPVLRLRAEHQRFATLKKTFEERAVRGALSEDEWRTVERGVSLQVWHREYAKLESDMLGAPSERERARLRAKIEAMSSPYYKRLND